MTTSRRKLLSLGAAAGLAPFLHDDAFAAIARVVSRTVPEQIDVKSFGAAGDAIADDTSAFQKALDAAHKNGGGVVYAPPGRYRIKENLTIPDGVSLRGSFDSVPSHPGIRDAGQPKPGEDGTALLVTVGRGDEDATAFLTLNCNSTLAGLTIYHPEQIRDGIPVAYPWTIAMKGTNAAVLDVELLNPYQGINAAGAARHMIRNVAGQPLRRGIFVDAIYDIGRIENVHFNPWWSYDTATYRWQTENGEAFIFGRADWEYVLNTFCFGYRTGYRFIETKSGACNGNFVGIGADDCNRCVQIEQCSPYGLLIVNGEFTSFHGAHPTMVEVAATNSGVVRINNSAFWGPCNQIAYIDGHGTVGFSDCTFVYWGREPGVAAVHARSGSVMIRGCEFRQRKKHIVLEKSVDRAIITGNLFTGPAQIDDASGGDVQIGLNAASR